MSSPTTTNTRRRSDSCSAKVAITRALLIPRPPLPGTRPRAWTAAPARRRPPRRRPRARARSPAPRRGRRARTGACPLPVSTSTPLARLSCSGVPAVTTSPLAMIATRSQTSSTSDSRCELSSTATPRSRSSSSRRRTVRRPAGSSALVGSSSSSTRGSPIMAWAIPRRCCMPFDIAPTRRWAASVSPTAASRRSRSCRPPVAPASRWCMASSSSALSQSGKRNSSAR